MRLHVELDEELVKRLDAVRDGRPRAALIRRALEDWLSDTDYAMGKVDAAPEQRLSVLQRLDRRFVEPTGLPAEVLGLPPRRKAKSESLPKILPRKR